MYVKFNDVNCETCNFKYTNQNQKEELKLLIYSFKM